MENKKFSWSFLKSEAKESFKSKKDQAYRRDSRKNSGEKVVWRPQRFPMPHHTGKSISTSPGFAVLSSGEK
jgi:hypothetical protein